MNSIASIAPPVGVPQQSPVGREPAVSGEGFLDAVTGALGDAARAMQVAETTSSEALHGRATIQNVVESVMSAERQLQTVLAIRDKVVAAYQEISRINI